MTQVSIVSAVVAVILGMIAVAVVWSQRCEPEPFDALRLAAAWGNVMDGRRIGSGLQAARIGRETTTPEDWRAIVHEYNALPFDEPGGGFG